MLSVMCYESMISFVLYIMCFFMFLNALYRTVISRIGIFHGMNNESVFFLRE